MSEGKNSIARILIGIGLLVMLSACQTSKQVEVMGAGDLSAQSSADSEGSALDGRSMGEEELKFGEKRFGSSGAQGVTPSDLMPEGHERMGMGDTESMGSMNQADKRMHSPLAPVFFDYDSHAIRANAVRVLQENARLLKSKYQNSRVLVEGHCDERGTVNYNVELGKRRAQAVKKYLIDLDVQESRIDVVSYGKERPFCMESEPSCWQQNRRGHFVLP